MNDRLTKQDLKEDVLVKETAKAADFMANHGRTVIGGVAVLTLIVVGVIFMRGNSAKGEDRAAGMLAQAYVSYENGDLDGAARQLETLVSNLGGSSSAAQGQLLYGDVRFGQGRYQEALQYYDMALAQLGENELYSRTNLLVSKAWALLEVERYDEAEALFREAIRLDPTRLSMIYRAEMGLGDVAFSQGECEQALVHFERAEDIEQERPHPWLHWYTMFGKALSHWCLGDMEQAEMAFNEAVDLAADFERAFGYAPRGQRIVAIAADSEDPMTRSVARIADITFAD